MAVSFTRISWWMWGGKEKEPMPNNGSTQNSSTEWGGGVGFRETGNLKFPSVKKGKKMSPSPPRKVKKKWQSREQRRIDREFDVVLVPSDGVCLSGSESEDSDWSIGWLERHGADFLSDDESDNTFAVLVPCYRPDSKELMDNSHKNQLLNAINNLHDEFTVEGDNYLEQWLSSLQNF